MTPTMLIVTAIAISILLIALLPARKRSDYEGSAPKKHERTLTPEELQRDADGFMPLCGAPIVITTHAIERYRERLSLSDLHAMNHDAEHAYLYGKSKRQVPKTTASHLIDIENRHEFEHKDRVIALLYANRIYLFTEQNVLVTFYPNTH